MHFFINVVRSSGLLVRIEEVVEIQGQQFSVDSTIHRFRGISLRTKVFCPVCPTVSLIEGRRRREYQNSRVFTFFCSRYLDGPMVGSPLFQAVGFFVRRFQQATSKAPAQNRNRQRECTMAYNLCSIELDKERAQPMSGASACKPKSWRFLINLEISVRVDVGIIS